MTPGQAPDPGLLRRAILSAIPGGDLQYFPPYFARALEPDVSLVTGIRGSGKSELCRMVHLRFDSSAPPKRSAGGLPDKDTLGKLLQSPDCNPRLIWKTVLLSQLDCPPLLTLPSWQGKYTWVQEHPEEVAGYLGARNLEFRQQPGAFVLAIDHFELLADTPSDRARLVRGVLELMLELRTFSKLRVKAFVNSDLLAQPGVADFPGAARVLGAQVELKWQPADLYGLLYAKLGGAATDLEARLHFQALSAAGWFSPPTLPPYWLGPGPAMDPGWQQALFGYLHQGGLSYASYVGFHKLPQDLTDSLGRLSPRTFLAAVRFAAEDSAQRGPGVYPLAIPSLQVGILAAARQWKQELGQDMTWVRQAMERLKGLYVPLQPAEVFAAWRERGFQAPSSDGRTPTDYDFEQALEGLQQVGALLRMADGRIEVPELYRLGFGLGRHGGFRPTR